MISLYSKLIGAFIFWVICVSAQKSLLTEKTSQTPNDHVIREVTNLRGVHAISKHRNMMTVATALLHTDGRVPIDQSSRTLTDGLDAVIVTVAGTGFSDYNGDGISATEAHLYAPTDITVDGEGNFYIADMYNNRVRKVTVSTGIISTIAGTEYEYGGYNGDGILATSAQLRYPTGVALDGSGNVYIADFSNNRVRKVTVSTGIITTIAGTESYGYNGDGILATNASLYSPHTVALDGSGNVYIADRSNARVRKVTVSTGIISTIAGTGYHGYNGDGILATTADVHGPQSVALDGSGNVYIAEIWNNRVRKVTVSTGIISTIAGTGYGGYNGDSTGERALSDYYNGDGILATSALLNHPLGVAIDESGNVYIVDAFNCRVRKVTVSTGIISTIAGTGSGGYNGDEILGTSAQLNYPAGVALDGSGNVYIADTANNRIRLLKSMSPTSCPSAAPSMTPTSRPSAAPSMTPTSCPSAAPSMMPTSCPSAAPSMTPTSRPSAAPSMTPTSCPSAAPSMTPTSRPSAAPSMTPTSCPSAAPSMMPTSCPSAAPSMTPTSRPSAAPSMTPTSCPSAAPSMTPTSCPSAAPSMTPTPMPSVYSRISSCKETSPPSSAPSHDCTTRKPTPKRNTPKPKSKRNTPMPTPKRNTPKPTPKRRTRKPSSRAAPRL